MVDRLKNHHESLKKPSSHAKTRNTRAAKNHNPIDQKQEHHSHPQKKHQDHIDLSQEAQHVIAWLQTAKDIQNQLFARGDRECIAQQCLLLVQGMHYLLTTHTETHVTSSPSLSHFFPIADSLLEALARESVVQRSKEALPYNLTITHVHFQPSSEEKNYHIHALTFEMFLFSSSHPQDTPPFFHDTFSLPPSFDKPLASSSSELFSLLQNTFVNAHVSQDKDHTLQLQPHLPSLIVTHNQPSRPILLGGIALKQDNSKDPSVSLSL